MQSWFSEQEDFIHISVYLFTCLVGKFRRWGNLFVCLFLFLLLSGHLEIIPVNKGTSLENSLTFQRERRRAEVDGQGEQDQSQANLKPTTMTQKPQAAHCLLYALPPLCPASCTGATHISLSLKIPFVLQCESNGFPHPSPSVVFLET